MTHATNVKFWIENLIAMEVERALKEESIFDSETAWFLLQHLVVRKNLHFRRHVMKQSSDFCVCLSFFRLLHLETVR